MAEIHPAAAHLIAADPVWVPLIERVGPCRITVDAAREPYEALVRAVAYQQLHGKAAAAILGRLLALHPEADFPAPAALLAMEETVIRGCGFSRTKMATILGIAAGAAAGTIPTRIEAETIADEDLITRLVALRGVGRWTVEMLLMFTLGRPDIMPADDFGVREGWRVLKGLEERPKPKAMTEIARAWSPYRSTAAWYLWRGAAGARDTKPSEVTG
jgi:DNA-3-methyladenine glycosylase II